MLLSFEQAKQKVLQTALAVKSPDSEMVLLNDALDRVTAKPIVSPINVPGFNNAAMDGYAIRINDLKKTNTLPQAGAIFAGDNLADLTWPEGTCLRIMTGAPVPNEADAVVMQELTEKSLSGITFLKNVKMGDNIRLIGEDVKMGTTVVPVGKLLSIPTLSTLATLGINQVSVFKPLTVAIFSTGNELIPIGDVLPYDGAIYDSNRFTLRLLLKKLNCKVIDLGIIPDDPVKIKEALLTASKQAHLIVTSGGVSVGDADYTKMALEELGQINFWKLAMKPGKPFAFGKIGNAIFCGLPGNPVSTLVTFYKLVQPLIHLLSGLNSSDEHLLSFKVKTTTALKKTEGRLDFQRGVLQTNDKGELEVTTTGQQGSHITQSFNQANCFIILERERGQVKQGELVNVEPFNTLLK